MVQKDRERLVRAGIPILFLQYREEGLSLPKEVLKWRKNFIASFTGKQSAFIHGPHGVGKSYLAASILGRLMIDGKVRRGKFISTPELLFQIRQTYGPGSEVQELDLLDKFRKADLMVLDDLGGERQTEWVSDILFLILDYLYGQEKGLLVTSNFSLGGLEGRVGERICSRLEEMCFEVHFGEEDRRRYG